MVPEPAKRCSSPLKAFSIKDGIPGKMYTLRTLTWEKKVDTSNYKKRCGAVLEQSLLKLLKYDAGIKSHLCNPETANN